LGRNRYRDRDRNRKNISYRVHRACRGRRELRLKLRRCELGRLSGERAEVGKVRTPEVERSLRISQVHNIPTSRVPNGAREGRNFYGNGCICAGSVALRQSIDFDSDFDSDPDLDEIQTVDFTLYRKPFTRNSKLKIKNSKLLQPGRLTC